MSVVIEILAQGLLLACPVLLAALGELIAERAGLLNIGVEGMMLFGALAAALGAAWSGGPMFGLVAALATGALCGLLFALLAVRLAADQVIVGAAMNLLALASRGCCIALWWLAVLSSLCSPRCRPPGQTGSGRRSAGCTSWCGVACSLSPCSVSSLPEPALGFDSGPWATIPRRRPRSVWRFWVGVRPPQWPVVVWPGWRVAPWFSARQRASSRA